MSVAPRRRVDLNVVSGMDDSSVMWNVEAESSVLGSILIDPNPDPARLAEIRRILVPDDFSETRYAVIYSAVCELDDKGIVPDPAGIVEVLQARGQLDRAGGHDLFEEIQRAWVHSVSAIDNAKAVRAHSVRRRVHAETQKAATAIEFGVVSVEQIAAESAERIARITAPLDDAEDETIIDPWPKLATEAFHGIAGDLVRLSDPHTEADQAATLVQFLTGAASLLGRKAHFTVGATRHYLNMFIVLVGMTALGRKGTSLDIVRMILRMHDPLWEADRIQSGLVSGEGLIFHVRDPVIEKRPTRAGGGKTGPITGTESTVVDPGVEDRRLLVTETEFSRTLKAMNREGNTLSDVLRQAWDSGNLATLGKNSPVKATGSHVSVIAHVTQADILKHMRDTDSSNGFANRFLWVAVRRSKELPSGGRISEVDWQAFQAGMAWIVSQAEKIYEMRRDKAAEELWRVVYSTLSGGRPGLLGAILSRAEAQTMRLACVYALLDGSPVVRAEHLQAALALWDYCEASARYVFGESHGDTDADKLVAALRQNPDGLTRKAITVDVFGRHRNREKITALLTTLLGNGLIHCRMDRSGPGRPVEWWHLGRVSRDAN